METIQPTIHEPQAQLKLIHQRTVLSGQLQSSQLIIKPKQLTKQDITELNQFGKIQDDEFILERSGRGYTLKNPVRIPLRDIYEVSSKGLIKYVIASLSQERPKLVPYVFENKSILKLANYLLRYRTGSPNDIIPLRRLHMALHQQSKFKPRPANLRRQRRKRTSKAS